MDVTTSLQRRIGRVERQRGRRDLAHNLHVRIGRLGRETCRRRPADNVHARIGRRERQVGGRRFAAQRRPPIANFQGGLMLGVMLGLLLEWVRHQSRTRQSVQMTLEDDDLVNLGLVTWAKELATVIRTESATWNQPTAVESHEVARMVSADAGVIIGARNGAVVQAGRSI
jgi:hypothetical protein